MVGAPTHSALFALRRRQSAAVSTFRKFILPLVKTAQKHHLLYCITMLVTQRLGATLPAVRCLPIHPREHRALITNGGERCKSPSPKAFSIARFVGLVASSARPLQLRRKVDERRQCDEDCSFIDERAFSRLRRSTAPRRSSGRRLRLDPPGRVRTGAGTAGLRGKGL